MKFANGCWLQKEHCECFAPKEIYFSKITEEKAVFTAPTTAIRHRGDTLGGINLTIEITAPIPEVFHIRTYHHKGAIDDSVTFDLHTGALLPLYPQETEDAYVLHSGETSLHIGKNPFSMTFLRGDEIITGAKEKDLALMKTNWSGPAYDKGDTRDTYLRQMFSLSVGELVYGMGERFTPFVKNGQTVNIWNEDGGTSTEQSYKNIPFYLTNRGYGVFVNHPEEVSFEIATEMVNRTQFSVKGTGLDYFFINGPSMKEVLMRYTDLTGKPSLPAPWTFGLWLSTSFTTNYDEDTVMEFIDGMQSRDIPLRTFHFDCFWMKDFHWSNLLWDERVFPDPAGMLKRIKEKGLNVCVWINPYIAQESELFDEGMTGGYFIRRSDGTVWQWDMWQPGMAIVDFTNPEACRWYQEKLAALVDMGVDCFKTDFGERIPFEEVCYSNGANPEKMHNYYTYLYNQCVYELLVQKKGADNAVLFARSATAGCQKFPVHWGGDCWSDYESMEQSLRGGLSLLMSGFGYWAHDIGGFESTSTADVYKRWVAFGLLSSHSRLHGSHSYRVPWLYDEESVDVVRCFTKLKARLMPYLFKTAAEASKTGIPMMRSMILEFPEDRNCHYLDKQYMLGDNLLVAPIFNDQSIAEYYLPEGVWTDFFTGKELQGGRWYKEPCDYMHIPLFVRENSILTLGCTDRRPDYDFSENPEFLVYTGHGSDSSARGTFSLDCEAKICNEKGIPVASLHVLSNDTGITAKYHCPGDFTLRFVNLSLSGEGISREGRDSLVKLSGTGEYRFSVT